MCNRIIVILSTHVKLYVCSVTKSCLTLCNPTDCSPPGTSVHGIFQARILEWVAISYSRGTSQPRDWTCVSCVAGSFFTTEPPGKPRTSCVLTCNNMITYMYEWHSKYVAQICTVATNENKHQLNTSGSISVCCLQASSLHTRKHTHEHTDRSFYQCLCFTKTEQYYKHFALLQFIQQHSVSAIQLW